MADKLWTTVGSAGTLSHADLAKVTLHQSIIQLGADLLPPISTRNAAAHLAAAATQLAAAAAQVAGAADGAPQVAAAAPHVDLVFPPVQAVVRYNVTPVDGVFPVVPEFKYMLRIRFRGQISAKLMEVDIITGAEKPLISFGGFPSTPDFQDQNVGNGYDSPDPLLDFTNKAYYVEATLTARTIAIGNPAAISVIQLVHALF